MKLNIELDIELVESFENKDTLARVYSPNEGNKIQIKKGLNTVDLSESIFHEVGHVIDWYISESNENEKINIREDNADIIGESLRLKQSSSL